MTDRKEVINACLAFPGTYEDYPFDDNWTAMRHISNKKTFAFIFMRDEKIWINVKAEPMTADFWKSQFKAVIPAYHMNKQHWISIILDGSMSDDEIIMLLNDSYNLTKSKKTVATK